MVTMEMEDIQPLCIICCYSYTSPPPISSEPPISPSSSSVLRNSINTVTHLEQNSHYVRFVEHVAKKKGIKLEELRLSSVAREDEEVESSRGNKLSVCPECLLVIGQAMERKEKADEKDEQIRLLQIQVASALSEFQGLMREFHEEMRKIEQIVRCSDVSCLEFRLGKENMVLEQTHSIFLLRDSIINASGRISNLGSHDKTNHVNCHRPRSPCFPRTDVSPSVSTGAVKVELDGDDCEKWDTFVEVTCHKQEDPGLGSEISPSKINALPNKRHTGRAPAVTKRIKVKTDECVISTINKSRFNGRASKRPSTAEHHQLPLAHTKTSKINCKKDVKLAQIQSRKEERRKKRLETESTFRTRNRSLHASRDAFMYNCQRCPFKTRRIYSFEYHLRQYETTDKKYKCPELNCLLQFSNKQFYDFHMTGHQGNYYYTNCEICQQFVVPAQIFQHMTDCHGRFVEKILQCPNCSYCCVSREKYMSHLRYHSRANGGGRFICDICYVEVSSRTKLLTHLYEVHAAIGKLECKIGDCQRTSLCPEKMQQHRYIAHKSGAATCEACGKVLQSKHSLKNHLLIYHSSERRPLKCDKCPASFVSKPELDRHQIRTHGRERFKCEVCEKSFMDKTTLNRHRAHQHEGKGFQCSRCEKTFSAASRLKRHELIHEPEKKWVCEYENCGKAFRYKQQLQGHNLIHEKIKKFQCPHCDKAFVRSDNLTCHIRLHTGERPFVCDVCGKAFNQSAALLVHKRNQHPAPVPTCSTKNIIPSDSSDVH